MSCWANQAFPACWTEESGMCLPSAHAQLARLSRLASIMLYLLCVRLRRPWPHAGLGQSGHWAGRVRRACRSGWKDLGRAWKSSDPMKSKDDGSMCASDLCPWGLAPRAAWKPTVVSLSRAGFRYRVLYHTPSMHVRLPVASTSHCRAVKS